MNWMLQWNPRVTKCHRCGGNIENATFYFRAIVNPDTPDAEGYDVCLGCRQKLPDVPPGKAILT